MKKEEKKIQDDEFQLLQGKTISRSFQSAISLRLDKPKFGEIVHAPPVLTLPRRSKANPLAVNFPFFSQSYSLVDFRRARKIYY